MCFKCIPLYTWIVREGISYKNSLLHNRQKKTTTTNIKLWKFKAFATSRSFVVSFSDGEYLRNRSHLTREHINNLCIKNCGCPVKVFRLGRGVLRSSSESNLKKNSMLEMSLRTSHLLGIMLPQWHSPDSIPWNCTSFLQFLKDSCWIAEHTSCSCTKCNTNSPYIIST